MSAVPFAVRPVDARAATILLVCCMIWGLQPIALKYAGLWMPPTTQLAIRSVGSAFCLALWLWWNQTPIFPARKLWRAGFCAGILFFLEFVLVAQSIRWTQASHLTVGIYTSPIFVAIGMHFHSPAERLMTRQWFGVFLAFAGIVVAFLLPEWRNNALTPALPTAAPWNLPARIWGDLLAVGAGLAWALTTLCVRYTHLSQASAEDNLMLQMLVGAIGLSILAAHLHATSPMPLIVWSGTLIAFLIFQAVIVSFLSYLAWFWLLRHYPASKISVFSFMTPIFGVAFSAWLLQEPIVTEVIIGATMIGLGILLVTLKKLVMPLKADKHPN